MIGLDHFDRLKSRIKDLMEINSKLEKEKKASTEQLLLMQKEIRTIKQECRHYQDQNQQASAKIAKLIQMLEGMDSVP